ncbi:Acyl-CoA synthetase (AMP-forming)/AMP-acid ligase II [Rhodospirillales bacterium URHD0017]|nr:Acyl-CoA synthetase (AMP-forming)/AMP-acid ligase II [Rhodospirillales bacterium URHD0017]
MARLRNILASLAANAREMPGKRAFGFLGNEGEIVREIDFANLYSVVVAQAESYRRAGLRRHQRVVVSLPAGLEFVTSFLSILSAGGVAVPIPSPVGPAARQRVARMVRHCAPHFIIATSGEDTGIGLAEDAAVLSPPDLDATAEPGAPDPVSQHIENHDLAFLQYTSGSTSFPKAVEVTHGMLSHNMASIQRAFEHEASSVFVSWLPHFHDMGLLGMILQPLHCGATSYLMAPSRFIRNPLSWLQTISDRRATTSGGPNFAYSSCLTALRENETPLALNLSCWRVAFNGSEPVRVSTMRAFTEAFCKYGLRPGALFPCYGMAENGLFVSGGPVGSGVTTRVSSDGGSETVSSGVVGHGQEVVIVDPDTARPVGHGVEGEIWIRSPSTARRYFRNEEDSATQLNARLEGRTEGYLRTGDIGFLADSQLHVAGRLKDIIIVNGRNVYPEDIEGLVLETLSDMNRVRVVAFGCEREDSESVVVLVARLRLHGMPLRDLLARLQNVIFDAFEGLNAEVHRVAAAAIPVTSSGKVRRSTCKQEYLRGLALPPSNAMGRELSPALDAFQVILGRALQREEMAQSLLELGFDSLMLARLAERLERQGIAPPRTSILARMSPSKIEVMEASPRYEPPAAHNLSGKRIGASLNQQSYAFHELISPGHPRSCMGFALSLHGPLDSTRVKEAFDAVLKRHSALSLRIKGDGMLATTQVASTSHHVSSLQLAQSLAAGLIREPMPLFDEPMCKAYVIASPQGTLLALQVHHAACDLYSLGLLIDDLRAAFSGGLPAEAAGDYRDFVVEQVRYLNQPIAAEASARWKERLHDQPLNINFPKIRGAAARLGSKALLLRLAIDAAGTTRLRTFVRRHEATAYGVLLIGFGIVLSRFSGQDRVTIASPFHGRRTSRDMGTVGLFQNLLPIALQLPGGASFQDIVRSQVPEIAAMIDDGGLPLSRIQHHFRTPRPLVEQGFDAMFTLQSSAGRNAASLAKASLRTTGVGFDLGPMTAVVTDITEATLETPIDLSVFMEDTIDGYLAYNPDVVSQETAHRLLEAFKLVLHAGLDQPETPISKLPVLTEPERAKILEQWAVGPGAPRPYQMAPELFRASAAKHPDKVAVSDARRALTYRELSAEIDRHAVALRRPQQRKPRS